MSEKDWAAFAAAHSLDPMTGKKTTAAELETEEPVLSRYELEQRLRKHEVPPPKTLWQRLFA
jgi:hypothetical protein